MKISPEELARFTAALLEQLGAAPATIAVPLSSPRGPAAERGGGQVKPVEPPADRSEPGSQAARADDLILAANTRDLVAEPLPGDPAGQYWHSDDWTQIVTAGGAVFHITAAAAPWLAAICDYAASNPTEPFSTATIRGHRPKYAHLEGRSIRLVFKRCRAVKDHQPIRGTVLEAVVGPDQEIEPDTYRLHLDWAHQAAR